jgi:redox-sensitive bicupin YhaK (pirin superfamily)
MTAGRGIVHSERRPAHLRQQVYVNHGLQLWTALPREHEEDEPSFSHTPAAAIPQLSAGAARVRVLVGEAFGMRSPVPAFPGTVYVDVTLPPGASIELPVLAPELALYPVRGGGAGGRPGDIRPGNMAVLEPQPFTLASAAGARLVLTGGEPLDGPRHLWWNFVSSRRERIVQASADWQDQRMGQGARRP